MMPYKNPTPAQKAKSRKWSLDWYHRNKHRPRIRTVREKQLARLRKYGIAHADLVRMWADQLCGCAVCMAPFKDEWAGYIDHDHVTGRVRGLLCDYCNVGLGRFRDNPVFLRRAAAYVG